jgi:hypothetical protein
MMGWVERRIACMQSRAAARLAVILLFVALPWAALVVLWVRS